MYSRVLIICLVATCYVGLTLAGRRYTKERCVCSEVRPRDEEVTYVTKRVQPQLEEVTHRKVREVEVISYRKREERERVRYRRVSTPRTYYVKAEVEYEPEPEPEIVEVVEVREVRRRPRREIVHMEIEEERIVRYLPERTIEEDIDVEEIEEEGEYIARPRKRRRSRVVSSYD